MRPSCAKAARSRHLRGEDSVNFGLVRDARPTEHQLQPVLTALLICVKEGLAACTDTKSAISYVQQSAAKVTPAQLQRVLEDHFMGAIREELQAPQPSAALD